MIPKANAYFLAAAAALGVAMTAGRPAVAETMLDQYTVSYFGIVEVVAGSKCMVVVGVNSGANGAVETRFVCDASGSAKLYSDFTAVKSVIESAKLGAGVQVKFERKLKAVTVGTPQATLIALHKAFTKEAASSSAIKAKLNTARNLAISLGWDALPATDANHIEYVEIDANFTSVKEVNDNAVGKVATYSALLTNAGINPVTYLPIVL